MATERTPRRKSTPTNVIKTPASEASAVPAPRDEEIARRAHEIFLARGGDHGHDLEDWLQSERELLKRNAGTRRKGGHGDA